MPIFWLYCSGRKRLKLVEISRLQRMTESKAYQLKTEVLTIEHIRARLMETTCYYTQRHTIRKPADCIRPAPAHETAAIASGAQWLIADAGPSCEIDNELAQTCTVRR